MKLRKVIFLGWLLHLTVGVAIGPTAAQAQEWLPGVDDRWRLYNSAHFELWSHVDPESSRTLLHDLEMERAMFFDRFGFVERVVKPVSVIYFSDDQVFGDYKPLYAGQRVTTTAAYYKNSPDRGVIALSPGKHREETQRRIFHEFVHHLLTVTGDVPPVWFDEGLAELFSTMEVERSSVIIGRPQSEHVALLRGERLMPLAKLFTVDRRSKFYNEEQLQGLFYAESWALLHYWFFGRSDIGPDRASAFIVRLGSRDGEIKTAFERAFGIDYAAMQHRLDDYIWRGNYTWMRVVLLGVPDLSELTGRAVTAAEIRLILAELAVRVYNSDAPHRLLVQAAEQQPGNARLHEIEGCWAWQNHQDQRAFAEWSKAFEIAPTNPAICQLLSLKMAEDWLSGLDCNVRLPAETAERLRTLLKTSITLCPDQEQGYEWLAWAEALAPEPAIANINLVQRHFAVLRDPRRTALALAIIRMRLSDYETAGKLLDNLDAALPPPRIAAAARAARELLARLSRSNSPPAAADSGASTPPSGPTPR